MPPIDLNVSFHEKDDARQLGARWDSVRKTWFLSDDADIAPFTKWLPQQPDINFRASSYFIAQSTRICWHCNRSTQVFGFLLPHGHEERAASDESVHWERQTSEAIIYYVTYIPLNVQVQMHSITNHYRNDFSKTTQSFYWMNHCEHCRMKQGDGRFLNSLVQFVQYALFSQTELTWMRAFAAIPSSRRPLRQFAASAPCGGKMWFGSPRVERLLRDRYHREEIP